MKSVEKQEGLAEHVIQDTVRMDVSLRPHPLAKSPLQPMLLNDQQGNLTACSIQSVVVKITLIHYHIDASSENWSTGPCDK